MWQDKLSILEIDKTCLLDEMKQLSTHSTDQCPICFETVSVIMVYIIQWMSPNSYVWRLFIKFPTKMLPKAGNAP